MPDMALLRKKKYACPHCSGALIVCVESTEDKPRDWYAWAKCECGARTPRCKAPSRANALDMLHECIRQDEVFMDFPTCPYCGESNTLNRKVFDDDLLLDGFHVICKSCGASGPIKSSSKDAITVMLALSQRLQSTPDSN